MLEDAELIQSQSETETSGNSKDQCGHTGTHGRQCSWQAGPWAPGPPTTHSPELRWAFLSTGPDAEKARAEGTSTEQGSFCFNHRSGPSSFDTDVETPLQEERPSRLQILEVCRPLSQCEFPAPRRSSGRATQTA